MARLFVLSGASIGDTFEIEGTSVVGRSPGADVTVPDASISRRHARLVPRPEPGEWSVVDLGSSNGVFVGGERVEKARLRDGDTFLLGEVELRLRDVAAPAAGEPPDGEPLALDGPEDFAAKGPAVPEGAATEPAAADPAAGAEEELELELEFDDELDEALASPPPPRSTSRPAPRPADQGTPAAPDRTGARATAARAARRRAALGSSRPAAAGRDVTGGGKPILQYARTRSGGTDLSQLPAWQKAVIALVAVGLLCGAAYGAFLLAS